MLDVSSGYEVPSLWILAERKGLAGHNYTTLSIRKIVECHILHLQVLVDANVQWHGCKLLVGEQSDGLESIDLSQRGSRTNHTLVHS